LTVPFCTFIIFTGCSNKLGHPAGTSSEKEERLNSSVHTSNELNSNTPSTSLQDNSNLLDAQSSAQAQKTNAQDENQDMSRNSSVTSIKNPTGVPTQSTAPAIPNKLMLWPVPSVTEITSDYRENGERTHKYINIGGGSAFGASVVAAMDGTVSKVVSGDEKLGNYVEITHANGLSTIYATLGSVAVSTNQKVTAGTVIAKVGVSGYSTGANLHFEVRSNNSPINPHLYLNN
jgi:murein DD-endopeptidase MepM/ murein hydrolase activator NlpD